MKTNFRAWSVLMLAAAFAAPAARAADAPPPPPPVKIVFDTDVGNDVDDVLALALLHALQSRGACELLAVTVTKHDEQAGPFVDAVDTFYGRPEIPVGCTRSSARKNDKSRFLDLADAQDDGRPRYPHKLAHSADAPEAVALLRRVLAGQPDGAVTLVQVGYFANLAALLDSPPDAASPLAGPALIKQKVRLLSVMAGAFTPIGKNAHYCEYNVTQDVAAARKLAAEWPGPIVWSGFEIGIAAPYPARSIERDFGYVAHHPAAEAYRLYNPPPHCRPTWDLTSALYAARPDAGYFELSPPGRVTVEADGFTKFEPAEGGRDRYLILPPDRIPRLTEALVQLSSQPSARGLP